MTTEWVEWDAFVDPPPKQRRKVRVELLPPQQPRCDVRVTYHRHYAGSRGLQHWLIVAAAIFVGLLVLRSPMALLLLGALVGWQTIAMFLFVIALLALIACREHRRGRPF